MRYTNFILTVIALCLIYMCLQGALATPVVATAPVDVRIVGVKENYPWDALNTK